MTPKAVYISPKSLKTVVLNDIRMTPAYNTIASTSLTPQGTVPLTPVTIGIIASALGFTSLIASKKLGASKLNQFIGGLAGAGTGVLGSLIYNSLNEDKSELVAGDALTLESTDKPNLSPITLIRLDLAQGSKSSTAFKTSLPVLTLSGQTLNFNDGPPGWLSNVIQHGMMVQTAQLKPLFKDSVGYKKKEFFYLGPDLRWKNTKASNRYTLDGLSKNLDYITPTTTVSGSIPFAKYQECPSPSFPGWDLYHPLRTFRHSPSLYPGGDSPYFTESQKMKNDGCLLTERNYKIRDVLCSSARAQKYPEHYCLTGYGEDGASTQPTVWLSKSPARIIEEMVNNSQNSNISYYPGGEELKSFPDIAGLKERLADYDISTNYYKAAWNRMAQNSQSGASKSRMIQLPSAYLNEIQGKQEFAERTSKAYGTARWLVWAGEMMRLHACGTDADSLSGAMPLQKQAPPQWWKDHCALWAIGCVNTTTVKYSLGMRRNLVVVPFKNDNNITVTPNPLRVQMRPKDVLAYLKLIVKNTPPPGHKNNFGSNILPFEVWDKYGKKTKPRRLILDFPDMVGSLQPPMWMDRISLYSDRWTNAAYVDPPKPKKYSWASVFMAIVGAVMNAMSAGIGTVITVPAQIGLNLAMFAYNQVLTQLMVGGSLSSLLDGTLSFVAKSLPNLVGLVNDFTLKMGAVSDTLKNAVSLDEIGYLAAQIPGAKQAFGMFQQNLEACAEWYNWDYGTQAFSNMLGTSKAGNIMDNAVNKVSGVWGSKTVI